MAKFTNLYAAYHAWLGDIHVDMWRCHEKYGRLCRKKAVISLLTIDNTVQETKFATRRTAYSFTIPKRLQVSLSIANIEFLERPFDISFTAAIYGNQNNVVKSQVYNTLVHRAANTLTLRDKAEHARRRRVMSSGFSDSSLRLLEPKILAQVQKFTNAMLDPRQTAEPDAEGNWDSPRNMAEWCASSARVSYI